MSETGTPELNSVEQGILASGLPLEEPAYQDYFGVEETHKWYFPDKLQWISFKTINEGGRARYQARTSRDITLQKATGNAQLKVDLGEQRRVLIEEAVNGWHLVKRDELNNKWRDVPFETKQLSTWINSADPKHIDDLVEAIQNENEWLLTENESVDALNDEIASLIERRDKLVRIEAGKGASS